MTTQPSTPERPPEHAQAQPPQPPSWSARCATEYPVGYTPEPVATEETDAYIRWFTRLRDRRARNRISLRLEQLKLGNPGDVRPVGEGVSELRINYGPGYRVYFVRREKALIILLAGGDKDSQQRDIRRAKTLAKVH